jgi:putative transposase
VSLFIRSYKYRLYPTKEQQQFLDRNFGAARFIWNALVANFNDYGTDSFIRNMTEADIKIDNPWLKECISYALQQKRMDFFEFMKQHFNKKRKKKLGRPKFKKKGVAVDSFRLPGQCLGYSNAFNLELGNVKIPKIKKPIKVKFDRQFKGQVKSVTISKNKINEYYISVCVEEEIEQLPKTYRDVGIDLGINDLLILSDGTKFQNPKLFRKTQAELKHAQKHLSRKRKGSNRYKKQKKKVAKIYRKVVRQREWYYHNISLWLVKNFDSIILEDLNVTGMLKNRSLAKYIADACWSTLVGMISYKARWYGKEVLQVGRFFPSSKLCSSCGHRHEDKMDLSVREWTCGSCGTRHDRDLNAAKNIYQEGMKKFHGLIMSEELPDCSRGETIRPKDFISGNLGASFNEATSKPIDFTEIYRNA